MSNKKTYSFGEKAKEYNIKLGKEVEVFQSPKYLEAKRKAIEILDGSLNGVLVEGDFWILMNATKSGKIMYTGLIISHNGCLKINDALPADKKFNPTCVSLDKSGYNDSLVYSYCNSDQGIYEVGEVSKGNCSNSYPYAMALKRLMDRVILKNSRLAYSGIYSDSEAEEFEKKYDEPSASDTPATTTAKPKAPAKTEDISAPLAPPQNNVRAALVDFCKIYDIDLKAIAKEYKLNNGSPDEDFNKALAYCKLCAKLDGKYTEEE